MPDYKEMYLHLFRRVTQTIEILQTVQRETEDIFVNSKEVKVVPFQDTKQPKE